MNNTQYIQSLLQHISDKDLRMRINLPNPLSYTGIVGNEAYVYLGSHTNTEIDKHLHIHIYFNNNFNEGRWTLSCRDPESKEVLFPEAYHQEQTFDTSSSIENYADVFYQLLLKCYQEADTAKMRDITQKQRQKGVAFGVPSSESYQKYLKYKMKYLELKKLI
jgi:hypothetical protein